MELINGNEIAQDLKEEIKSSVDILKNKNIEVKLAVVQVGDMLPSNVYVKNIITNCQLVGITPLIFKMDESVTEDEVIKTIESINNDDSIGGVIVQLPLPRNMDKGRILNAIDYRKDIDGLSPRNIANLYMEHPYLTPSTPGGVIELLKTNNVKMDGANCVIVGRSDVVGKPMALLMLKENATVTIAHSHTENLKEICKKADILIVAIGKANFFNSEYVKEGAVVVDVGINCLEDGLIGDVDMSSMKESNIVLTPVPGGVGPMTVATLMKNCIKYYNNTEE